MDEEEIINIRELDMDLLQPTIRTMYIPKQGGLKTTIIGKPGTGKNVLIKYLLEQKKHIFPVGMFQSGSESETGFFTKYAGGLFVYDELDLDAIERFYKRQKIAKKHLKNPWAVLVIDDCTDEPKDLNSPIFRRMYKNGRHWKMWLILSLQVALDVKRFIRTCTDDVFILREPNILVRKSIWENYAGIIPDFNTFCQLMDQITEEYHALYIKNNSQTNNWKECVFYCKATVVDENSKFGCPDYHEYQKVRLDPDYNENQF